MKGCLVNPDYDCEAFDGKHCLLVMDEPCHYAYAMQLEKEKEPFRKRIQELLKDRKK